MSCVTRSNDPDQNAQYLKWLRNWATSNSDGCTGALPVHVDCCFQHDWCYHYHTDPWSVFCGTPTPISKADADLMFRRCNEDEDPLGRFSPLAWWRWWAVKWFGGRFFTHPLG